MKVKICEEPVEKEQVTRVRLEQMPDGVALVGMDDDKCEWFLLKLGDNGMVYYYMGVAKSLGFDMDHYGRIKDETRR